MTTSPLAWRTSSYTGAGENCVDVAPSPASVLVRHSKRHADGIIEFTHAEWAAFVTAARDGSTFDGKVTVHKDGTDTLVTSPGTGIELRYDKGEWDAFVAGANDREFDFAATT